MFHICLVWMLIRLKIVKVTINFFLFCANLFWPTEDPYHWFMITIIFFEVSKKVSKSNKTLNNTHIDAFVVLKGAGVPHSLFETSHTHQRAHVLAGNIWIFYFFFFLFQRLLVWNLQRSLVLRYHAMWDALSGQSLKHKHEPNEWMSKITIIIWLLFCYFLSFPLKQTFGLGFF